MACNPACSSSRSRSRGASQIARPSQSRLQRPSQSRLQPPSQSRVQNQSQANANKSKAPEDTTSKQSKDDKKDDKKINFQLPPLSVVGKKKEIDFEYIRKKVIRRGNPEGEDKKQLASILKHLKESKAKVRVQEYVNLVSKYTCDNGETMRKVTEEDLASFRKMVTKVYENMTQDVSDVLVNEQIQTTNFYQERYDMFNNKMLWMISEIFQMIPEFDFEKYAKDKSDYLNYVCPIPALIKRDDEEVAMQKRQEAFHRLQWLKIEESRLAEENRRLDERLEHLKEEHKKETNASTMKNLIMEERTHDLEMEEQEKQERLTELENVFGKNIVRTEAYLRLVDDETVRMTKTKQTGGAVKKKFERRKPGGSSWSKDTAVLIEEGAAKTLVDTEMAMADEKKRAKRRERAMDRETLEYSEFPSARQMQERVVQQTTTTTQEKRPKRSKGRCGGGCG